MDAKCGDVVFTPRHGKPVEINALWYHALCLMASRTERSDPDRADHYRQLAWRAGESFEKTFWNERCQCLYDVVRGDWADPAVRPNQIFAVSLPHSPLHPDQQKAVVDIVASQLLTPFGLRSLCPKHPAYAGHYGGGPFDRDSVYHQGTVWGWLIGPFVEAYLRVHEFSAKAKADMRDRLGDLIRHLDEAGLESVSEIFDGDPPHAPRGCIAQAWSVSELLRAWRMTEPA
jgi:predicted glycogen debranching enzyme